MRAYYGDTEDTGTKPRPSLSARLCSSPCLGRVRVDSADLSCSFKLLIPSPFLKIRGPNFRDVVSLLCSCQIVVEHLLAAGFADNEGYLSNGTPEDFVCSEFRCSIIQDFFYGLWLERKASSNRGQ